MKNIEILKLKPKNISFKKIKHKKRWTAIIILLIIISIIGAMILKPKETIVTDYTELAREDIVKNVNTLGTVKSDQKITVYSTLNNVVKEVKVEAGDKVNEGDVLCILDSSSLEREINEASKNAELDKNKAKVNLDGKRQAYENAAYIYENNIDSSISDCQEALNSAKIKLDDSQRAYEQKKALYENGAAPQSDFDDAKSSLDQAQSDYNKCSIALENAKVKAKQEVDNAKNEYDSAFIDYSSNKDEITIQGKKEDLNKCIIKAPTSGTITSVNAYVGNPAQGILFTIENLDDPIIVVNIKEIDINKISAGQDAEIITDATPDDEYASGKVLSISDSVKSSNDMMNSNSNNSNSGNSNNDSSSAVFEAKIKLDNSEENDYIKVGMNAKANIILDKSENVFSVPFSSILEEDNSKYIKIAKESENGKYEVCKIPVTTGLETDASVEVENNDLKEGDKLLLDPTLYDEGMIVTLMPNDGGSNYE